MTPLRLRIPPDQVAPLLADAAALVAGEVQGPGIVILAIEADGPEDETLLALAPL